MGVTTIKISDDAWLALKQCQVDYKGGKAPECGSFRTQIDAIGDDDDDLLALFRKKRAAIRRGRRRQK